MNSESAGAMFDFQGWLDEALRRAIGDQETATMPEAFDMRSVTKVSHTVPISEGMAMDYGLIPDTRPPVVISRRTRFRWWRQDKARSTRMGLASFIAGFDVENGDA